MSQSPYMKIAFLTDFGDVLVVTEVFMKGYSDQFDFVSYIYIGASNTYYGRLLCSKFADLRNLYQEA